MVNSLASRKEIYLKGAEATRLNTVDVWNDESDVINPTDERVWVMYKLIVSLPSPC